MKKILFSFLSLVLAGYTLFGVNFTSAKNNIEPGTLIKGKTIPTVYYVAEDDKRYVFPNANTFFSWYDNFDEVVEVEDEDLYDYPLAGNVRYKPGKHLIKIQTDPKVYAVGQNGNLHWIKNETLARALYGANWNLLVDDVPDSFFTNYTTGDPVEEEEGFDPVEEEEEIPTISYNRGFKARLVKQYTETKEERKCQRLERNISLVQERLARWGIEADSLGEDYFNECFAGDDDNDEQAQTKTRWRWHNAGKIQICHITAGDPGSAQTISVSIMSAKAHLAHGDTLGPCVGTGEEEEPDTNNPIISNIEVTEVSRTSALVSWDTDEISDSQVKYALETFGSSTVLTTVSDEAKSTEHQIELTGLVASTTYYFKVYSTDESSNKAVSDEYYFTTLSEEEPDTDAPVISFQEVSAEGTGAEITWSTDEMSDSKIIYSSDHIDSASTTTSVYDSTLTTTHTLTLSDLATSTVYYFVMESTDEAGNTATSTEESFTSAD